jgi:cellulose biosynthesis protein BcsQ
MNEAILFDQAIGAVINQLHRWFDGKSEFGSIHIVRDSLGSLTVVLPDSALSNGEWEDFAEQLDVSLGVYSPGASRVLLGETDLIDPQEILNSPDKVSLDFPNAWLIDRLLTNQDWLRPPLISKPRVPTAVAFSVKGGVGRSTAFSFLGWNLARRGKNVLLVDLDLEAPGIGSILLDKLPKLGLIDWIVESINGQGTVELLESAIGTAPIAHDASGTLRVLAAYGVESCQYISKLGRVYGNSFDQSGLMIGLAERLRDLLDRINNLEDPPDVVLLDARAGLHDIGSAAITRLSAEVFLFARNDEQDWWSYKQIFDHLRHSASVAQGMGNEDDLRWKLKMVAAQTAPNEAARKSWVDRSYKEWAGFYDDESFKENPDFEPVVFSQADSAAPHFPLFINFEPTIRGQSLSNVEERPEWDYIQGIFGDFFKGAEQRLWPSGEYEELE